MARKVTYLTGDDVIWVTTFRNNLGQIIRDKHIRKKDLYAKLGVTAYEYKSIVYGSSKPSDEFVHKLMAALDCTMDDLLDEDGDPWNFGKSPEEIAELNTKRKREREEAN